MADCASWGAKNAVRSALFGQPKVLSFPVETKVRCRQSLMSAVTGQIVSSGFNFSLNLRYKATLHTSLQNSAALQTLQIGLTSQEFVACRMYYVLVSLCCHARV